jgi:hypothetical protein
MPSPFLKKIAKETGKSMDELESYWEKAKEITSETFGKKEKEFGSKEYSYATAIVKNMSGMEEKVLDPSEFLKSDLDSKKYLETLSSSSFNIANVTPPEKKDITTEYETNEEEEEDKEEEIPEMKEEELDISILDDIIEKTLN